jgi:dipeptidyl-peptidase-3
MNNFIVLLFSALLLDANQASANRAPIKLQTQWTVQKDTGRDDAFEYSAESFADLQLLRYQIPGWNALTLKQKELCYYLYEAALCGRDIIYDQKDKNGILLRKTLDNMYGSYSGNKSSPEWKQFEIYCGRFWFSNGNHHHYGNEKFIPECSWNYFVSVAKASNPKGFPLDAHENLDKFLNRVKPLFYDPLVNPKCVDLSSGIDNIKASSRSEEHTSELQSP